MLVAPPVFADTPEEVCGVYFNLLREGEWGTVAELYDSQALADFKDMMSFILEIPDEEATEVFSAIFGPGTTKEDLTAMSDSEFFSSFLGGVMAQTAVIGQLDFTDYKVLGSVPEGDDVRHVVTRMHVELGEIKVEAMEVISFRKRGDDWKILMQGKMKGVAEQLRKGFRSSTE
jgi:hypothetical protein